MEKLIEILEGLNPDVDYETCEDLVDGRHLDSLTILSLISEIEDEFEIEFDSDDAERIKNINDAIKYIKEKQK